MIHTITEYLLGVTVIIQALILRKMWRRLEDVELKHRAAIRLISAETKRKVAHTKAFEELIDPDKISEEMERNADIIEARQANRLHAPRPDAGPPAKVYRPRFSGKRASFWNPPRA